MPPTLVHIDGFEHRVKSVNGGGLWVTVTDTGSLVTFDTTVVRTGVASLKIAFNGSTAVTLKKTLGISGTAVVGSLYFRVPTTPTGPCRIIRILATTSAEASAIFRLNTSGQITCQMGTGTLRTYTTVIDDDTWHRLEWSWDVSTTTPVIQWQVDGNVQTNATSTTAVPDTSGGVDINTSATEDGPATVYWDDLIISLTLADYPLGDNKVLPILPDGAGTHNNPSAFIQDEAGNAPLYTDINEWPSEAADYIRQTTVAGTEYVEFTLEDTTETTIWDVHGYLAYTAESTQANNGTTRIVLSDGTTVEDIFSNDMSDGSTTNHFYKSNLLTRPSGGWTQTNFNGCKARVGFSSNATPDPYWLALLLQVAVPVSAVDTLFAQALF